METSIPWSLSCLTSYQKIFFEMILKCYIYNWTIIVKKIHGSFDLDYKYQGYTVTKNVKESLQIMEEVKITRLQV